MAHDGTGTGWDINSPADTEFRNLGDDEIRDLRRGIAFRINKEHDAMEVKVDADSTGTDGGGEHLEGSARAYVDATAPTALPNAETLSGSSFAEGRLWVDTDTDAINYYDSGWVACTAAPTDGSVTTAKVVDLNITTAKLAAQAVTEAKIHTSVAGAGITGGNGTPLAVVVDDSTIEISGDTVQVKDGGITLAKLATAVRGRTYIGSYTGNGGSGANATTGVGFQPKALLIWHVATELVHFCLDHTSGSANHVVAFNNTSLNTERQNAITMDSDGFTIANGKGDAGLTNKFNDSGETYWFLAIE
jgi:hypothetical protein